MSAIFAAPAATPRRARDRGLCAGQEHGAGRRAGLQAFLQRDAARPEPEGDGGLSGGGRRICTIIPTVSRRGCARRSAKLSVSIPTRIVCGAGSDELLNLLAHAYLGPGDEAIHTRHGFLVYPIWTLAAGATPIVVAETHYTADVDAILSAVTERTRIVFLANPNNPTGTYLPFDEIKRLHQALPAHVLLVLDAAYAEYVRRNDYESGIELVATTENTVMCRTFSKIHGLAAHAAWLALRPRDTSSTRSTASADRSTSTRRRWPPASPRWKTPPIWMFRAHITSAGSPG